MVEFRLEHYMYDQKGMDAVIAAEASKLGISKPMCLFLQGGFSMAQSIKAEIQQSGVSAKLLMPCMPGGGSVFLLSEQDATSLLRTYCGPGGALVADKMERETLPFYYLNVGVLTDQIEVFGMGTAGETFCGTVKHNGELGPQGSWATLT